MGKIQSAKVGELVPPAEQQRSHSGGKGGAEAGPSLLPFPLLECFPLGCSHGWLLDVQDSAQVSFHQIYLP